MDEITIKMIELNIPLKYESRIKYITQTILNDELDKQLNQMEQLTTKLIEVIKS